MDEEQALKRESRPVRPHAWRDVMAKAMARDPAIGVWKLNLTRSSFKRFSPPQSGSMTVEPWGDGLKVTAIMIDARGNKFNPQIAYKFDGRDYPLKDSPLADT